MGGGGGGGGTNPELGEEVALAVQKDGSLVRRHVHVVRGRVHAQVEQHKRRLVHVERAVDLVDRLGHLRPRGVQTVSRAPNACSAPAPDLGQVDGPAVDVDKLAIARWAPLSGVSARDEAGHLDRPVPHPMTARQTTNAVTRTGPDNGKEKKNALIAGRNVGRVAVRCTVAVAAEGAQRQGDRQQLLGLLGAKDAHNVVALGGRAALRGQHFLPFTAPEGSQTGSGWGRTGGLGTCQASVVEVGRGSLRTRARTLSRSDCCR